MAATRTVTYRLRPYRAADRDALLEITAQVFGPGSLDRMAEEHWGQALGGTPWWQRKQADVANDCDLDPAGIFVAVDVDERVVAYVTTRLWRDVSTGWIHNLAVAADWQGKGLARALLVHALDYFRAQGMTHAKIETLAHNEVGRHLYPAVGFEELAQQVHYTMDLSRGATASDSPPA